MQIMNMLFVQILLLLLSHGQAAYDNSSVFPMAGRDNFDNMCKKYCSLFNGNLATCKGASIAIVGEKGKQHYMCKECDFNGVITRGSHCVGGLGWFTEKYADGKKSAKAKMNTMDPCTSYCRAKGQNKPGEKQTQKNECEHWAGVIQDDTEKYGVLRRDYVCDPCVPTMMGSRTLKDIGTGIMNAGSWMKSAFTGKQTQHISTASNCKRRSFGILTGAGALNIHYKAAIPTCLIKDCVSKGLCLYECSEGSTGDYAALEAPDGDDQEPISGEGEEDIGGQFVEEAEATEEGKQRITTKTAHTARSRAHVKLQKHMKRNHMLRHSQ